MSQITRKLSILGRCQLTFRANHLRESGLFPPHYNYVIPICRNPGLSQEQLARRVYFDKYNVTRHLNKLEENGFVERRPSEADKRVMLVYPTQKMLDLLPRVRQCIEEWDALIFEGLSAEELEQFDATLTKITQRAQEYVNSKDVIEG
jgi:DNA-binding MarR family transcriptional regulator